MTLQVSRKEGITLRRQYFAQAKRVIIKVGSAVLTGDLGIKKEVIMALAKQISFLQSRGKEVILVSSGAMSAGRQRLGKMKTPHEELRLKQALAATGQGLLMHAYEQAFIGYHQEVAQVLLTHADLANRKRYLNIRNTIFTLFELGIVPILNENDTVSTEELGFSDNDSLAALITNMIGADMLFILTDVDGLYTGNPSSDPQAKLIYTIKAINGEIEDMAGHSTTAMGTGGMLAKIRAAKMVAACGGTCFIGPGSNPHVLQEWMAEEKSIGTFFLPIPEPLNRRKHWIAYVLRPEGFLILDAGACEALIKKGKSLLPSGIRGIEGHFGEGAPVHCRDERGRVIAAGLSNYSSTEIAQIKGRNTSELTTALGESGKKLADEVIHRDNLVLMG